MENNIDNCKLLYNTERVKLWMPEYGRNVQKMVDYLKTIEDREKRNEQAKAVIKVMETINPAVKLQEDYEHKLWDHLHIISGFSLDVDSPYPVPAPESLNEKPMMVPIEKRPIKATHYGRNIENLIDLVASTPDGDVKTEMIRTLALYMRQQYLIGHKDSVSDQTMFQDIERLSDNRIKVPEGLELNKVDSGANFSRPGNNQSKGNRAQWQKNNQKNNQKNRKQHNK